MLSTSQPIQRNDENPLDSFELNVGVGLPDLPEALDLKEEREELVGISVGMTVDDALRELFVATLSESDGNISRASSVLGISMKTGYNWAKRWNIPLPSLDT